MNPILLVFDNDRFAQFLQFVLTTAGFSIERCNDPLALFEKVKETNPRLIVMDIFLKHIDGLYLLERLYAVKEYAQIPVLIVSSRNEPLAVFDALERGAADYLAAPINEDMLIEKVKKLLKVG
ncbi:MAG: response regulator [Spirochaetes bacterium]|nr:response regulator [Spirochaetota bacterium]